jgi:hypothetical protein
LTEHGLLASASVSNFEMRGWSRYWRRMRSQMIPIEGIVHAKRFRDGRFAHERRVRVKGMMVATENEVPTQSRS